MFHLLTHAFFKALLFLGSGSVILGCHHEQDVFKMGGLRKAMPRTFWTYLVGTAALAGVPLFSGFFSKDEILLDAVHFHAYRGAVLNHLPWLFGTLAAFLTAFYMTRQVCLVFFGEQRDHHYHPHESPNSMTVPLMALAVFAFGLGFLGFPGRNLFHHFVAAGREAHAPSMALLILAILIAAGGIAVGYAIYGRKPLKAGELDPLRRFAPGTFKVLENKYYVDELYHVLFAVPLNRLAWFFGRFDVVIIDGVLHAIGRVALTLSNFNQWIDNFFINGGFDVSCGGIKGGSGILRRIQNGLVQNYLLILTLGSIALVAVYILVGT